MTVPTLLGRISILLFPALSGCRENMGAKSGPIYPCCFSYSSSSSSIHDCAYWPTIDFTAGCRQRCYLKLIFVSNYALCVILYGRNVIPFFSHFLPYHIVLGRWPLRPCDSNLRLNWFIHVFLLLNASWWWNSLFCVLILYVANIFTFISKRVYRVWGLPGAGFLVMLAFECD